MNGLAFSIDLTYDSNFYFQVQLCFGSSKALEKLVNS